MATIDVGILKTTSTPDFQAILALKAQLSSTAPHFSRAGLAAMLADPAITMFAARADGTLVGMTTVAVFRVTTGLRAFIDDVVVMQTHRWHGLGEALVAAAIDHAAALGTEKIDLTSRPSLQAANRLYQRMGFERRETNVYRLDLSKRSGAKHRLTDQE